MGFMPFPTIPPKEMWDFIKKIGKKVSSFLFGNNEEIANSKSSDLEKVDISEIAELNSILVNYKSSVEEIATPMEQEIVNDCAEFFHKTLNIFERVNEDLNVYRVESIKRKFDRMLENMNGTFEKHTAKRISLDDSQCISILKMMPGELKGQRMKEYRVKVFQESIEEIIQKMTEFIDDLFETIGFSFDNRIEDLTSKLEEKTKIFSEISDSNLEEGNSIERAQLKAIYIISAIDLIDYKESIKGGI